ncbi:hypothetical protein [Paenibacillus sp. NPDC055715]
MDSIKAVSMIVELEERLNIMFEEELPELDVRTS